MVTQNIAIETGKRFVEEVLNLGINLKKAYLFGSYAAEKQREHSDIDIALIADEFTGIGPVDVKMILKALRNYSIIQPITYATDDLITDDPFLEEIKRTGVEIL